jgi:N-acetylmuramoyl-L-alanine amidase
VVVAIMVRRTFVLNRAIAESADKRIRLCAFSVLCVLSTTALGAAPARTMYTDALAREQTVRAALSAPDATAAVLADVHAVIAAYESIARRYPASGYTDNALWQSGCLALDAYTRFMQAADKDTAVRLLHKLADGYPTSKLARQVPAQLAHLDAFIVSPPKGAPADTPPSIALRDERIGSTAPPTAAVAPGKLALIRDIRRSVLPDAVRITIEMDGEVPFHDERIADPSRVFLDLPGTRPAARLTDRTLRFEGDADIVRQVRIGRHPNNITRIVLDAANVTSYSVYPLYNPYRLVIDCVRLAATKPPVVVTQEKPPLYARTTAPDVKDAPPVAKPLAAKPTATVSLRPLPSVAPREAARIADASVASPATAASPAATATAGVAAAAAEKAVGKAADMAPVKPVAPPSMPPKNLSGGFSIARQLGLGISRIVIDPGHGGHDPGAKGKGVTESEVVLDVALRLEKLLQKVAGVEVILTRRTDDFIPLPERTAIANREGADLFLSIHANASSSAQARGVETYFLNFANNLSAAAVAARENAASGQAMAALPDLVKSIALNNKLDESRDFATQIQREMFERLKGSNKTLRDLGVKQAPFVVLIGAAMPSVLAEISFVTNPAEARLLKGNAYRQKIAESLFNAIRKYQGSLKNMTAVALQ